MSSFVRILWTWSSWECFQTYKPTDSLRKNQPVSIAWRNRCRIGLSKDLWLFKAHWTMLQWFIHLAELAEVVRQDAMSTKIPWMPSTKKNSNLRLQRKNTTWPKKQCAEHLCQHLFSETQEVRSIVSCSPQRRINSQVQWLNTGVYWHRKKRKQRRVREENRSWWVLQTSHLEAWQADKMSVTFVYQLSAAVRPDRTVWALPQQLRQRSSTFSTVWPSPWNKTTWKVLKMSENKTKEDEMKQKEMKWNEDKTHQKTIEIP